MKSLFAIFLLSISLSSFAKFQVTEAKFYLSGTSVPNGNYRQGEAGGGLVDTMTLGESRHIINGNILIKFADHETGETKSIRIQNAHLEVNIEGPIQARFDLELNLSMSIKNFNGNSLSTFEKEFTGRLDGARFIIGNFYLRMKNEDGVSIKDTTSLLGMGAGFASSKVTGRFNLRHEKVYVLVLGDYRNTLAYYSTIEEAISNEVDGTLIY
ncbi:MAG: hypothetical protein H6621_07555 [Halobacteriovoraceae bacterium]|nr:hypothetical protein [Halobacteriovoraceae bacterium]